MNQPWSVPTFPSLPSSSWASLHSLTVTAPAPPEAHTSAAPPAWMSLQKQLWKAKEMAALEAAKADLREGPELGWSLHSISVAPDNLQQPWSLVRRALGDLVLPITCLWVRYNHP